MDGATQRRQTFSFAVSLGSLTYRLATHIAATLEPQLRGLGTLSTNAVVERQGAMTIFRRQAVPNLRNVKPILDVVFDDSSGQLRILSGFLILKFAGKANISSFLIDHDLFLIEGREDNALVLARPAAKDRLLKTCEELKLDRRLERVELDLLPPSVTVH